MNIEITNLSKAQNNLINEVLDSVHNKTSVHGSTRRTARRLVDMGLGTITVDRDVDMTARFSLSREEFNDAVTIVKTEILPFGRFTTATLNK